MNLLRRKLEVKALLLTCLSTQQKRRGEYPGLSWIKAEQEVMHTLVNQLRVELNKSTIDLLEIAKVEKQAAGHSDYPHKFALYCAELVVDHE